LRLAMFSTCPNWTDGVNDETRGQIISPSDFCLARRATSKCPAFGEELWPGGAVNCAIDSAAAEQRGVCCVHNGINLQLGDVAADDVDLAGGDFQNQGASRSICQEPSGCRVYRKRSGK